MNKTYKHIGYYNDVDDCKFLFAESPEYIVNYIACGFGNFHSVNGDDDTDVIWGDEHDMLLFQKTADERYIVRYERGNGIEGWYIDVYQLREEEPDNRVEEYCGECDTYVMLENELKVQKCPNCGKAIVPCSALCPMLFGDYSHLQNCSSCPLATLCEETNKTNKESKDDKPQYDGEQYTPEELVALFDELDDTQLQLGVHITIPQNHNDECDEELYFHYNILYEAVVLFDVSQHGKAFTWSGKNIPPHMLREALYNMCGREVQTLYVRPDFMK